MHNLEHTFHSWHHSNRLYYCGLVATVLFGSYLLFLVQFYTVLWHCNHMHCNHMHCKHAAGCFLSRRSVASTAGCALHLLIACFSVAFDVVAQCQPGVIRQRETLHKKIYWSIWLPKKKDKKEEEIGWCHCSKHVAFVWALLHQTWNARSWTNACVTHWEFSTFLCWQVFCSSVFFFFSLGTLCLEFFSFADACRHYSL